MFLEQPSCSKYYYAIFYRRNVFSSSLTKTKLNPIRVSKSDFLSLLNLLELWFGGKTCELESTENTKLYFKNIIVTSIICLLLHIYKNHALINSTLIKSRYVFQLPNTHIREKLNILTFFFIFTKSCFDECNIKPVKICISMAKYPHTGRTKYLNLCG